MSTSITLVSSYITSCLITIYLVHIPKPNSNSHYSIINIHINSFSLFSLNNYSIYHIYHNSLYSITPITIVSHLSNLSLDIYQDSNMARPLQMISTQYNNLTYSHHYIHISTHHHYYLNSLSIYQISMYHLLIYYYYYYYQYLFLQYSMDIPHSLVHITLPLMYSNITSFIYLYTLFNLLLCYLYIISNNYYSSIYIYTPYPIYSIHYCLFSILLYNPYSTSSHNPHHNIPNYPYIYMHP